MQKPKNQVLPEYELIIKEKGNVIIQNCISASQTADITSILEQLGFLKISSELPHKIIKDIIPNYRKITNPNIKSDVDEYTKTFTATYSKNENSKIELKIESLNDINRLLKCNKVKKFYDFMLNCLSRDGLKNGYLRLSYSEWLKYTNRSTSPRMIKEARKEIRTFRDVLKKIEVKFNGKNNMGYDANPFYDCDTSTYTDCAEIGIAPKFIEAMGDNYYILPFKAGQLKENAYSVVTNLMWYCRVNKKESGKPFNIGYDTLCEWAGIPNVLYVKDNHNSNYEIHIYKPLDSIIKDIRNVLSDNITIPDKNIKKKDNYVYPNHPDDTLKKLEFTISEIDYTNIIKLEEKYKKKQEKTKRKKTINT